MSQSTYYITTAIDYVNAAPHLGHAYEKVATDAIARFQRLLGKEVFFLTGTDEHGTKVAKTAAEKGLSPKQYTDEMAEHFIAAWRFLNLTHDGFIRTTDPRHYEVVTHLWNVMQAKDDIYKASYTGNYCTGCETFLLDRDLNEEGHCAIHQRPPEKVEEENYFFRLSKYKDELKKLIGSGHFVKPDFRAQEVLKMLDELEDISVSRPRSSVDWGIPVPGDEDQVIYVWIDALSNYLTGIGYRSDEEQFKKFWPADCHMIGKDILRFHALYWPAMLMSAEVPLPKQVFAHGFINLNDAKISKSIGNVVAPVDVARRFDLPNPDPIRYYLLTVAPFGQDGNFTEEDFKTTINADLANNIGNLLNRTLNMTKKYFEGKVPNRDRQASIDVMADGSRVSYDPVSAEDIEAIGEAMNTFQFQKAAELIIALVDKGNRIINSSEPWNLHKEGKTEDLEQVIYTVLDIMRQVAILLSPLTPSISANIWNQLGYENNMSAIRWNDLINAPLPAGQPINLTGPVLPRLEDEIVGAAGKKK